MFLMFLAELRKLIKRFSQSSPVLDGCFTMFSPHDLTAHLVWLNEPTPGSLPPNVLPGSDPMDHPIRLAILLGSQSGKMGLGMLKGRRQQLLPTCPIPLSLAPEFL